MNIQWFPGHMTKTRRMIEENIRLCDCVVELCDARCPKSSRNPDLPRLTKGKKLLLVINKCDIADPVVTQKWLERYRSENINVIASSSNDSKGIAKIFDAVREMMKDEIEKNKLKGYVNKPIRIMVCGIPNVGKSSFINKLYGKAAAKAGDKPGVTRGKQWITLKNGMELLDTPGILWPKFDDKDVALRLAYTGAVKDEILDVEELASNLLKTLSENYAQNLKERYKIELEEGLTGYEILERVSRKRGFILRGNEVDYLRGANIVLDEFRGAKLGRISLES